MENWQKIIAAHCLHVSIESPDKIRVFENAWTPETGQQYDEIIEKLPTGGYSGVMVLHGTDIVDSTYQYENLRHFLGY